VIVDAESVGAGTRCVLVVVVTAVWERFLAEEPDAAEAAQHLLLAAGAVVEKWRGAD
jgi:hypothetical protein